MLSKGNTGLSASHRTSYPGPPGAAPPVADRAAWTASADGKRSASASWAAAISSAGRASSSTHHPSICHWRRCSAPTTKGAIGPVYQRGTWPRRPFDRSPVGRSAGQPVGSGENGWTFTQQVNWGMLFFGILHWVDTGELMCSLTTWYWVGP